MQQAPLLLPHSCGPCQVSMSMTCSGAEPDVVSKPVSGHCAMAVVLFPFYILPCYLDVGLSSRRQCNSLGLV